MSMTSILGQRFWGFKNKLQTSKDQILDPGYWILGTHRNDPNIIQRLVSSIQYPRKQNICT
ncbi:MAG: hypothetical protein PVH99_15735 [Desulfobacteraceae bacterium]